MHFNFQLTWLTNTAAPLYKKLRYNVYSHKKDFLLVANFTITATYTQQ